MKTLLDPAGLIPTAEISFDHAVEYEALARFNETARVEVWPLRYPAIRGDSERSGRA